MTVFNKKIYLTVSQMDKYEQCITKRRREVGVARPVATSREPNKIFIGTWRQNMSQLEDSLVLSVDNSVPVSTPLETTNIGTTEMGSDLLTQ